MDELSMFAAGEFDLVIHPVSTCYVPQVAPVFRAVARVVRPGGLYISQHKAPVSLQASLRPGGGGGYALEEPYYRAGPLPAAESSRLRERGYAGHFSIEYFDAPEFDVDASVLRLRDHIARYFEP